MNVTSALPFDPNATGHGGQQNWIWGHLSKEHLQAFLAEMIEWTGREVVMRKVGCPVILTFGTFGNIMTILVLRKMLSDQSGFPLLFMALAFADFLVLCVYVLPGCIKVQFGTDIKSINSAYCKLNSWLEYSFVTLASWLLEAMTVQRALSIVCPLWMRRVRPRRQALVTIAGLTALSLAVASPDLFLIDINAHGLCDMADHKAYIPVYWSMSVLSSALPFTIIVVCNILTIRVVVWRTPVGLQGSARQEGNVTSRVTATLILMSVAFVVLTMPHYVMYILLLTVWDTAVKEAWLSLWQLEFFRRFAELLLGANSAINFFLYMLTGTRFRAEVKSMLGKVMAVCSKTRCTSQPEQTELTDF